MTQPHVTQFLDYLSAERNRSVNTIENYRHDLLVLGTLIGRDASTATLHEIRQYLSRSLAGGLSPRTARRRLSALRSFFDFLVSEDVIETNPCRGIHAPKGSGSIIRPVSNEKINRVIAAFPDTPLGIRDKAAVLTLYGSALRSSELGALRVEDVDFAQEQIFVHQGKGGRDRLAPMNALEMSALRDYLRDARPKLIRGKDDPGWLFLNRRGTALTRQALFYRLRGGTVPILGRKVSAHKFRHAACTEAIRNGMDVRVAQEMMGHSSPDTTLHYVHTDFAYLKANYLKLHPRGEYVETVADDRPHRTLPGRAGRGEHKPMHHPRLRSRPARVCRVYRSRTDCRSSHAPCG
jgi:site-specific recombinase XerD